MKQVPKPNTDEDLIRAFLDKGGEVKKGKTKPMPTDLGLSNNQWGNKLTKEKKGGAQSSGRGRKEGEEVGTVLGSGRRRQAIACPCHAEGWP